MNCLKSFWYTSKLLPKGAWIDKYWTQKINFLFNYISGILINRLSESTQVTA